MKKRIFDILEISSPGDRTSRFFDVFIIVLISLNVLAVILETETKISAGLSGFLHLFELISVIIFTIEYLLRIWSCTVNPKYGKSVMGRLKFMLTPLALVDLFAILPFYLPLLIPFDLRFLRVLRLIRIFRLFKLGRYSDALKLMGRVIKAKKAELYITVFIVFILLVFSSSVLYYVEHETQPEVFSSIPSAMWWGISALTTVGYGDAYPITPLGKFFGAIISLLGIGLIAMPTGILSAGFIGEIKRSREGNKSCPHCGGQLE